MREQPTTPEGHLIRYYRQRLSPVPTAPQMAQRLGWKTGKYQQAELGRTRARRGNPPAEYHPTDADLVDIAKELGITPEELEKTERHHAAERLRDALAAGASPDPEREREPGPDVAALLDRLVEAIIRDRDHRNFHDRETLEFLWRGIRNGKPKPLEERIQGVIDWIEDQPRREAKDVRSGRLTARAP